MTYDDILKASYYLADEELEMCANKIGSKCTRPSTFPLK